MEKTDFGNNGKVTAEQPESKNSNGNQTIKRYNSWNKKQNSVNDTSDAFAKAMETEPVNNHLENGGADPKQFGKTQDSFQGYGLCFDMAYNHFNFDLNPESQENLGDDFGVVDPYGNQSVGEWNDF